MIRNPLNPRSPADAKPNRIKTLNPFGKLGIRFISLIVLVAVLAGGIGSFILIRISHDSIQREALNNNNDQAQLIAGYTSNYISMVQAQLRAFASRPDIRQAVINDTPEDLQSTISQFAQIQPSLDGV